MFLIFISAIIFAAAFFSAENLVTTIVGFIISMGVSQWIKNQTGLQGVGAMFLAILISFAVAAVGLVVSWLLGGEAFSWDNLGHAGLQIFGLATAAYKLLLADPQPNS